jgi:uncharacterized coiled-coil protein SlyX
MLAQCLILLDAICNPNKNRKIGFQPRVAALDRISREGKDVLMSEIAIASINTFGPSPKADFVQPSEEQIFVLTSSQLQDLVTQAVEKAIQSLQDRIESLETTVACQEQKIATLEATTKHQEDNQFIQLQLISQLREATKKEPQPLQRDRGEILRVLLAANGGKMLAKDARKKMRIPKSSFSELLKTCDFIEVRPYHLDTRQDVLVLKSQLLK